MRTTFSIGMASHLHLLKIEVGNLLSFPNTLFDAPQVSQSKSRRIVIHVIFESDIIQIILTLPCLIRKVFLSINTKPSQVLQELVFGITLCNNQPSIPRSQMLGCLERKAGEVSPLGKRSAFVGCS